MDLDLDLYFFTKSIDLSWYPWCELFTSHCSMTNWTKVKVFSWGMHHAKVGLQLAYLVVHPTNRLGGLVDPGDFLMGFLWGQLVH